MHALMIRGGRALVLCALTVLFAISSMARADGPDKPDKEDTARRREAVKDLGFFLFKSTLLSKTGRVSCATCHDPENLFTDGLAEANGILQMGVGRNSPTLVHLSDVQSFPDPRPPMPFFDVPLSHKGPRVSKLRALTLEERCLAPIENPLEMGTSVEAVVASLKLRPGMNKNFDRAFGNGRRGVTIERVGKALSAYVGSLKPREAPFLDFLKGTERALSLPQKMGLKIFSGRGRCITCHSGPALSDGLMHVVTPRHGPRAEQQRRRGRVLQFEASRRLLNLSDSRRGIIESGLAEALVSATGYGPPPAEVQTTTLWDVARTSPYFRDGSVTSLREAVRRHVVELRRVSAEIGPNAARIYRPTRNVPQILRPKFPPGAPIATPEQLSPTEIDRLVTFMRSFSPRSM